MYRTKLLTATSWNSPSPGGEGWDEVELSPRSANFSFFRIKTLPKILAVLLALTLFTPRIFAWNNVGHRVVAELAWRQMTVDERHSISIILKQHPLYQQMLAVDVPPNVDTNEWAFLNAANWPDQVRKPREGRPKKPASITKYDLYPHAVGYPFLGPGETNRALLENFYIAHPDAAEVLSNSIVTVKNKNAAPADRAVSLCWMIHLMGDLHQPLHAANTVTKAHPRGDQLGGHYVALNSPGHQIDLHAFWDDLLGTDPGYHTAATVADRIAADPALQRPVMKEYQADKTIAAWVQESFQIAVNFSYATNHVRLVHKDDLASGKISHNQISAMTPEYIHEAEKIAQRRVALAADRLADELKEAF